MPVNQQVVAVGNRIIGIGEMRQTGWDLRFQIELPDAKPLHQ